MAIAFNSKREPMHDAMGQDVVFGAMELLKYHR